jgi:bla regulator protein blaR1
MAEIRNCGLALVLLAFVGAVMAQTPAPSQPDASAGAALPAWEVSTVRPAKTDAFGSMFQFTQDGIRVTNVPLWAIVRESFRLHDDRLFGGPAWEKTSMFDIEAKVAPEDAPKLKSLTLAQRWSMLVPLLEQRFGFKYHHEMRDLPEYELVVAKDGIRMTASKPDPSGSEGHGKRMLSMHGRGHMESINTGMSTLAGILSAQLGRTVVDKTGLTGTYDYKLDWTPDDALPAMATVASTVPGDSAEAPDTSGPSLFTALEEQLGLKLEAVKGPVDVVVIDQLVQPTAN